MVLPDCSTVLRADFPAVFACCLAEKIGRLNVTRFDRKSLAGSYVSKEQPSIIDAFCYAENMVLMATELGISSCIIARGEETFDNETGRSLLNGWNVPENYIARCFVLLGYCAGEYPKVKPRGESRCKIVE